MFIQANYASMTRQPAFKGALNDREKREFQTKITLMSSQALLGLKDQLESKINSALGDGFPAFVKKEKEQLNMVNVQLCTRMTDDGDYKEPKYVVYDY